MKNVCAQELKTAPPPPVEVRGGCDRVDADKWRNFFFFHPSAYTRFFPVSVFRWFYNCGDLMSLIHLIFKYEHVDDGSGSIYIYIYMG